MNFFDRCSAAIERNQSLLYVSLDPDPELLPMGNTTQIREYLKVAIAETTDKVCAYKLNFGFYQVLGAAGLELLSAVLGEIPEEIPVILDAKHGDATTSTVFAQMLFERWRVDACTLLPYAGLDQVAPFIVYPGKAVFVLCYTSNPSGSALQDYPSNGLPLYLHLIQESKTWGTPEQLGLQVDAAMPDVLARVRSLAPERLILLSGDYSEAPGLTQILAAGLNSGGDGLLIPVPPTMLLEEAPGKTVATLRDSINGERLRIIQGNPSCDLWLPDVCFLNPTPHRDLILQLYDIGCIIFGEHVQASGEVFPYYIDLRKVISQPEIFHKVVNAYAEILKGLKFDRIAGIPYGSLPTATGLALRLGHPMIFPRKEVKAHGTQRMIEGHYESGEKVVVVDDILITGNSVMKGADKLQSVGLEVEDIVVFIDHERGVKDRLKERGYRGYAVLTLSEIAQTLQEAGRVSDRQFELLTRHH